MKPTFVVDEVGSNEGSHLVANNSAIADKFGDQRYAGWNRKNTPSTKRW